jgi:hypothetical protein
LTDIAEQPLTTEFPRVPLTHPDGASRAQSGAGSFPELVWAHFRWERERHWKPDPDPELEKAYLAKLAEFEKEEGRLEHVYWCTRNASAVAMTVKPARLRRKGLRIHEHDEVVQLHRVSDWVTRDAPGIADLLHECDLLAIRIGEILRGTGERIAMRWILGVEAHLLGFFERTVDLPAEKAERELVRSQRKELVEIEQYYHRAAAKAGRIVYLSGMLIGIALAAAIGAITALLFWAAGLWTTDVRYLLLCYAAGAVGALVSAMSRMSKQERGRFNIDFELGRPLMRRLGVFRPFVGAVIGVALYALLASGILQVQISETNKPYYYGFAAFLAGFSERFANVVLGSAEKRLAPAAEAAEKTGGVAEEPV